MQSRVQVGQHVRGRDVDAGDRLLGYHQPGDWCRRRSHRVQRPVAEQLRVGAEERRIPAEQDQAGYRAEHGDAHQANDRQPEFPALDAVDPAQVSDLDIRAVP
jgi:hypothetical protein